MGEGVLRTKGLHTFWHFPQLAQGRGLSVGGSLLNRYTASYSSSKMALFQDNKELQFGTCCLMVNCTHVPRNEGEEAPIKEKGKLGDL